MFVSGTMCKWKIWLCRTIIRIMDLYQLLIPNRYCWWRYYHISHKSVHLGHGLASKCPAKSTGGDRSRYWKATTSMSWRVMSIFNGFFTRPKIWQFITAWKVYPISQQWCRSYFAGTYRVLWESRIDSWMMTNMKVDFLFFLLAFRPWSSSFSAPSGYHIPRGATIMANLL